MNVGLRNRMLVQIGGMVALALVLSLGFLSWRARGIARELALNWARAAAEENRTSTARMLEAGLITARTVALGLEGVMAAGNPVTREGQQAMMKETLRSSPLVFGVWCMFEPGEYDGLDAEFAGKAPYDKDGSFTPYFTRRGENISFELPAYDGTQGFDYYRIPLGSGREALIDPYIEPVVGDMKNVMMASACVPVRRDKRVVGVVGVDMVLTSISEHLGSIRPYGRGYAYLLGNAGKYVAHPDAARLGKSALEHGVDAAALAAVREGRPVERVTRSDYGDFEAFVVYLPVRIGDAPQAWSLALVIPMDAVMARVTGLTLLAACIAGAALLVVLAFVYLLARHIARPVSEVAEGLETGAHEVSGASGHLASTSQALAQGSTEQAGVMQETSVALAQIVEGAQAVAKSTENAREQVAMIAEASREGEDRMRRLADEMRKLGEAGARTQGVVRTIEEIAFQTNLLALNAAVEAARAGAAGGGFAVVADEVRSLARRAGEAAKESADLIDLSVRQIQGCSGQVTVSGEAMQRIDSSAQTASQAMNEVSAVSAQQCESVARIRETVRALDTTTQGNAAKAEETAASAEELSAQAILMETFAEKLNGVISGAPVQADRGAVRRKSGERRST